MRDAVVDYVRYWADKTDIKATKMVNWMGGTSTVPPPECILDSSESFIGTNALNLIGLRINPHGSQKRLCITPQPGEKRNSTFVYAAHAAHSAYDYKFLTGISKLLFRDSPFAIFALISDNTWTGSNRKEIQIQNTQTGRCSV